MPVLPRLVITFSGGADAIKGAAAQARDLSPVMRRGPGLLRFGTGSLQQQTQQRAQLTVTGERRRWVEAPYATGRPASPRAAQLERVLWDAALGTGAGSYTRVSRNSFSVGVDDEAVRRRSAELGNQIVSRENYFGFVTGNWGSRSRAARARWTKPTNPRNRRRVSGSEPLPPAARRAMSSYSVRLAAWWFIGRTYGVWLSEQQLREGLLIPPKGLGWSKPVLDRIRAAIIEHVIGKDALARGRANDPRARRGRR